MAMGYKPGEGLGLDGSGRVEPVAAVSYGKGVGLGQGRDTKEDGGPGGVCSRGGRGGYLEAANEAVSISEPDSFAQTTEADHTTRRASQARKRF